MPELRKYDDFADCPDPVGNSDSIGNLDNGCWTIRSCMSSPPFRLVIAKLATCFTLSTMVQVAPADDVSRWWRSDSEQRPLNAPRQLRYRHRVHGLGWEIRSDRFVVSSKTNVQDAKWTLVELESAWKDMSELADPWTKIHRDPHFAIGPVLVVIDNEPNRQRSLGALQTPVDNDHRVIYINVSNGQPPLEQQRKGIRRAATRSFLQLTQLRLKLPTWVQDGFVEYVGAMKPASDRGTQVTPASDAEGALGRSSLGRSPRSSVTFLLTGKDAFYAPLFHDALRRTIAQVDSQRRNHYQIPTRQDTAGNSNVKSWPVPVVSGTHVDRLVNLSSVRDDFAMWKFDTETGQPIFDPDPDADGLLLARQQEMIVLLKLAHRFHRGPESIVQTAAPVTRDQAGPESAAKDTSQTPFDLLPLYDQLTDRSEWATLDVDGSLLLSSNTKRVEQILGRAEQRYRAVLREGLLVLQHQWDAQTVLELWLEQNPQKPQRPIARFKVRSLAQP